MIRIETFTHSNADTLEDMINEFLGEFGSNIKLVDIKFSTCTDHDFVYFSAMVIFKRKEDEQ